MTSLPVAPDGGWGWVVVAAAFICNALLDGIMFSFGILFLELQDYFGENKGKTALVGSVLLGMSLLLGPVVSVMVNSWGERTVAIAGSLVAFLAFVLGTFSPDIEFLIFTYGFLGGFGISMVYLSTIIIIGFYFEKKRALANGITSSGSGIGTFLFAPLCYSLQEQYNWKGTLLILSALALNCAVCGALFRPLQGNQSNFRGKANTESPDEVQEQKMLNSNNELESSGPPKNPRIFSLQNENVSKSAQDVYSAEASSFAPWTRANHDSYNHVMPRRNASDTFETRIAVSCCQLADYTEIHKPMSRKDIFYSGSISKINAFNNDVSIQSNTEFENQAVSREANTRWRGLRSIYQILPLSLLRSATLYLCTLSFVLWTVHFTVMTMLPDYAIQNGIEKDKAALILSIIGATNTAARLLAGWLSDQPRIDCIWVNGSACLLGGAASVGMAYTTTFIPLSVEAGVFGFCMGTWTSLRPIILVELLGLENLTNSIGIMAMFQGLALIVGPPLNGLLYEVGGSYSPCFLLAATSLITSGLLCTILRRVRTCEMRRSKISL